MRWRHGLLSMSPMICGLVALIVLVPVGNLIRLANEAESRDVSIL
jgi:hypothetical protein